MTGHSIESLYSTLCMRKTTCWYKCNPQGPRPPLRFNLAHLAHPLNQPFPVVSSPPIPPLCFSKVGDYVKVEADRGEDLGMVVTIFPVPEAGRPLPATAGQKRGFGQFEKEHIIRAATEDEVRMM